MDVFEYLKQFICTKYFALSFIDGLSIVYSFTRIFYS